MTSIALKMNKCIIGPLEQTALVKIASGIYNISQIKNRICSLEWEDEVSFLNLEDDLDEFSYSDVSSNLKEIMSIITDIICEVNYPVHFREKILETVEKMVIEIMKWITYHSTFISASIEDYQTCLFNSLHWSPQALINKTKTAELLVKDPMMDICDRFKLACVYCFEADINVLWNQLPEFLKKIKTTESVQPKLVQFWSNSLFEKSDDFDEVGFMKAIGSDSEVASIYFWKRLLPQRRKELLTNSSLIITGMWEERDMMLNSFYVISEYYANIMYFLISEMNETQQINFLQEDIRMNNFSMILCCFLVRPYQDLFIPIANQMWSFLPLDNFTRLLYKITNKIAQGEKHYDYRHLLKQFWIQSPTHYKMFFLNRKINEFLARYFQDTINFKSEDVEIICLIMKDATSEEKDNFHFSFIGKDFCYLLIKEYRWKLIDALTRSCLSSEEQRRTFIKDVILSISDCAWFNDFFSKKKCECLEQFTNWCLLFEEIPSMNESIQYNEIVEHRSELIMKFFWWCLMIEQIGGFHREDYKHKESTIKNCFEVIESFVTWCFSSREQFCEFKKKMIYHLSNVHQQEIIEGLILKNKLEVIQNFITWCLSSKEEINNYKKKFNIFFEQTG